MKIYICLCMYVCIYIYINKYIPGGHDEHCEALYNPPVFEYVPPAQGNVLNDTVPTGQ
jgi:hypothetical protein